MPWTNSAGRFTPRSRTASGRKLLPAEEAVVQKVGRGETGVLAVTTFAESIGSPTEDGSARPLSLVESTPDDSVTLIYSDTVDGRWPEICEFLDRTLAAAIARFSTGLG